jgi:hypothetical protein
LVVSSTETIGLQALGPEHAWLMFLESHAGFAAAMAPPNAPSDVTSLGINSAKQAIASEAKLRIFIV